MRPRETVRLTREQLYELVWSKPMTEIGAEFGMSDVAFAKYCTSADVPRPGRGYWQRLESGQKQPREPLPKRRPDVAETISIDKYERPTLPRRAPEQRGHLAVPDRITRYHPVVRELDDLLRPDVHHQGLPTVRGHYQAILKVTDPTRRRALRLLHALFLAVERQGQEVRLTKAPDAHRGKQVPRALEFVIDGEPLRVSLREHLNQKTHKLTASEKKWSFFARKYDLVPSGELVLELDVPWGAETRTRWRDGPKGRLEDLLGEVVWAVGEAAQGLAAHRARVAEEQRRSEIARKAAEDKAREGRQKAADQRRQRAREARAAAHKQWLHDDLLRMTSEWRAADGARRFLSALVARVPTAERTVELSAWLTWATEHAEALDPLNAPTSIAKPLVPSQ